MSTNDGGSGGKENEELGSKFAFQYLESPAKESAT